MGAPHKSGEKTTALNSLLWIQGTFLLGEGREGDKLVAVTKEEEEEEEGGINQSGRGDRRSMNNPSTQ